MKRLRADLHLHTEYSFDCNIGLDEMIERCQRVGLDCVAVTDHDTIAGATALARRAPFKVIIGEEISARGGHILGLFLSEAIAPALGVRETIEAIHDQGGVAVAAHPFSRLCGHSLNEALVQHAEFFDAVEIANSNSLLRGDDRRAERFARERGLASMTGSDAHRAMGIGSNIVTMGEFETPGEFVASLREATFENRVHPWPYFVMMGWHEVKHRAAERLGIGRRYDPVAHFEAMLAAE